VDVAVFKKLVIRYYRHITIFKRNLHLDIFDEFTNYVCCSCHQYYYSFFMEVRNCVLSVRALRPFPRNYIYGNTILIGCCLTEEYKITGKRGSFCHFNYTDPINGGGGEFEPSQGKPGD
jgi:hypothetical protein